MLYFLCFPIPHSFRACYRGTGPSHTRRAQQEAQFHQERGQLGLIERMTHVLGLLLQKSQRVQMSRCPPQHLIAEENQSRPCANVSELHGVMPRKSLRRRLVSLEDTPDERGRVLQRNSVPLFWLGLLFLPRTVRTSSQPPINRRGGFQGQKWPWWRHSKLQV